jgi:hypothetical protein
MTTTPARDLWLAKAARLEEDRRTLLRLLERMADTRVRLNGSADGLVTSAEFEAVEAHIRAALTALNERQNGYIAEMMEFEPMRDEMSGRLGGMLAGDVLFSRNLDLDVARALRGHQLPVISRGLLADVEQIAEKHGVGVRFWIEETLRARIWSRAAGKPEGVQEAVRRLVTEEGPLTVHQVRDRLGIPRKSASNALSKLQAHGKVACIPGRLWISTEE